MYLQDRSCSYGHTSSTGDIHRLGVEGDFLIFPGCGIIPKELRQLESEWTGEDHAARGLGKPEDKFFDRPSGRVELLLSDLLDGYGGRTF